MTTGPNRQPVAIIGLGCVFPDAPNVPAFWAKLLEGYVPIREVPAGRWDPAVHYSPDRTAPDRTYSRIGAFVTDLPFNPIEFRIPPRVAASMDEAQKMALVATREALQDAGLLNKPGLDGTRVAVVVGNSMGGETKQWTDRRVALREAIADLERDPSLDPAARAEAVRMLQRHVDSLPPITEDTMPGELSNVIAGRIAQVFNFQGKNHTADAACASTLAALEVAVRTLERGEADIVVCGGADRSNDPSAYIKFSKIGALSAEGSFPFDERASGFVMGEGCGMLVLKRFSDAQRDGDRIYAVVTGVGASSDGKGKGITAPNPTGQDLAIRRALQAANLEPAAIRYVECHGTATAVGDVVEAEVLAHVFAGLPSASIGIGSVKGNIGHLKSAANAASLIKVALAIHHGTIPPTPGHVRPNPRIAWASAPLKVVTQSTPWPEGQRRAGVSGFGFGGTNFHAILEEPPVGAAAGRTASTARAAAPSQPAPSGAAMASAGWSIAVAAAPTREALVETVRRATAAAALPDSGFGPVRVAFAYETAKGAGETLKAALDLLEGRLPANIAANRGVFEGSQDGTGKLGFVYPGQGSQYAGMLVDLAAAFPEARETLEAADRVLAPLLGAPLSHLLVPGAGETLEQVEERLRRTEICQPAVLACDVAIHRILGARGIRPAVVAGHSLGEYAALVAAGVLSFEDALVAVSARGKEMASVHVPDKGTMAFVAAPRDSVERVLQQCSNYVVAANKNSPAQTVIAGSTPGVEEALQKFAASGIVAKRINVSAAFHSEIVAPAVDPLGRVLGRLTINAPRTPLLSNVTAELYPQERSEILQLLARQVASPVEWETQIRKMHAMGVRVFVEVGPKNVLTRLVPEILGPEPHAAVATNHPKIGGVGSLHYALAALLAHGVAPPQDSPPRPARQSHATTASEAQATPPQDRPRLVITGAAIGLPGRDRDVFADDNVDRLFAGENRIDQLTPEETSVFTSRNIQRLVKDADGTGRFETVTDVSQVIRLAGRRGRFDLARDYGLDPEFCDSLDISSKLAIAAGLEALKDAGIPLVRHQRATSRGTFLPGSWVLPPLLQDDTGVIFASAFPGYDNLLKDVERHTIGAVRGSPPPFDRKFLFRALAMGHSQFAQLVRARGPNLQINAACASTTSALALAEDWIRAGRCRRVIVIAADDATSEHLLQWTGSGFLAAGAATTAERVEEGALPFDRRRHGMIIGMGAAALVVEPAEDAAERGMEPVAELAGTFTANSAYHGSRLDPEHIAACFDRFAQDLCQRYGLQRDELAKDLVFVSHETYTPARGGSASAEVAALRRAFGPATDEVLVVNIKGFTGHPQGVGLEDVMAAKGLQHRRAPPIPNHREPDPELGRLNLSQGGRAERRYAIRLAAGFGSQLALAAFRQACSEPRQTDPARYRAWVERACRVAGPRLEIVHRTLRIQEGPQPASPPTAQAPRQAPPQKAPAAPALPALAALVDEVRQLMSQRTGYPIDLIEPHLDLESDLGIDTVKQAELFGEVRQRYGLERDDTVRLADYNTVAKVAQYIASRLGGAPAAPVTPAAAAPDARQASSAATPRPPLPAGPGLERVLADVTALVSQKTGYPTDLLDPKLDLEGDLGIDTVKQAELFGAAREKYGLERDDNVRLSDYNTLEKVAAYVHDRLAPGAGPTSTPPALRPPTPTPADAAARGIQRMTVNLARLPGANASGPLQGRLVLLVPDAGGVAQHLQRLVEQAGGRAGTLRSGDLPPDAWLADLSMLDHDAAPRTRETFAGQRQAVIAVAERLRSADALLRNPDGRVILACDLGGHLGLDGPASFLQGGVTGLAKALAREFPAGVRALDLGPADAPVRARWVLEELLTPGAEAEVCRNAAGRFRAEVSPADAPPAAADLPADAVLVVTGGAQGITGHLVQHLAQVRPGWRFLLLGRTRIDAGPTLDPDDPAAVRRARDSLVTEARAVGLKPAELERRLDQILKAARARKLLQAIDAGGDRVAYKAVDVRNPDEVMAAVAEARRRFGRIDAVIHAAGLERSKMFLDKPAPEWAETFDVKAAGAWALLEATRLDNLRVVVGFGSVAGRFGNPGQTDYSAGNDALAKLPATLQALRPGVRAVTVHWTAWDGAGMATRESVRKVLTQQGVTFLPLPDGQRRFLQELLGGRGEVVHADVAPFAAPVEGQPVVAPPAAAAAVAKPQAPGTPAIGDVLADVTRMVSGKTGYPVDLLDPRLDLESDLGIDTVRQAELFVAAREKYGLERDDTLKLSDYNTLEKVAAHLHGRLAAPARTAIPGASATAPAPPQPAADAGSPQERVPLDPAHPAIGDHSIRGVPWVAGVYGLDAFARAAAAAGLTAIEFRNVEFQRPLKVVAQGTTESWVVLEPGPDAYRAQLRSRFTPPGATATGEERVHFVATVAAASAVTPAPTQLAGNHAAPAGAHTEEGVLRDVTLLVAAKTGYPTDLLDPRLDLESDLGIDTVKQAELFVAAREKYGLPRDDTLKLSDYNTLEKIAAYLRSRAADAAPATAPGAAGPATAAGAARAFGRNDIYDVFFHGPRYQVIDEVRVGPDRATAVVRIPDSDRPAAAFLAVEAAFQTAGCVVTLGRGQGALPVKVARIAFGPADAAGACAATAFEAGADERGTRWDIMVTDAAGAIVARVEGLVLARADFAASTPVAPRPPRPVTESSGPQVATLLPPTTKPAQTGLPRATGPGGLQAIGEAIARLARDAGLAAAVVPVEPAWADPDARPAFLGPQDLERLGPRATAKRRAEHVAGVWAAKRAAAAAAGLPADERALAALAVQHGPLGEPEVRLPDGTRLPVSVSHGHGIACAVAPMAGGGRPGLDIERVEPRAEAFVGDVFTPGERAVLAAALNKLQTNVDGVVTLGWALKEAALKAAGLGLTVDLHAVQLREVQPGTAVVSLPDGRTAALQWALADGFVTAVAPGL